MPLNYLRKVTCLRPCQSRIGGRVGRYPHFLAQGGDRFAHLTSIGFKLRMASAPAIRAGRRYVIRVGHSSSLVWVLSHVKPYIPTVMSCRKWKKCGGFHWELT